MLLQASAAILIAYLAVVASGQGAAHPGANFFGPPPENPTDLLVDKKTKLFHGPIEPEGPPALISWPNVFTPKSTSFWRTAWQMRTAWCLSLLGCAAIVLCGVLPAFLLTGEFDASNVKLNRLLGFAVGSLLGDVFLHILPETWEKDNFCALTTGGWIIFGLLLCFLVEKFSAFDDQSKMTAFMNLVANLVDNFTHGLAVAGGFLIDTKFGLITTFAILIHEIPHEVSDFAILLRGNFSRITAIKAQLITAIGGVVGATVALASATAECDELNDTFIRSKTGWILPFTAGGFLNIALVQVLPDLLKESNKRESLNQIACILLGIASMGVINVLV